MKTCLDPSGDRQVSTPIQFKGMGTCKGVSSSVGRSRYVSWCMDSPALPESSTPKVATEKHSDPHAQSAASGSIPLLLLSPPETNGGETFSHQPLQAKLLHSSHQHASPHHSNLSLMKPYSNTDSHSDEGEDKGSEDDNLTNLSPPGAENRSEEDSSLLHPEANRCRLRRSSPVIYRRLRPISWHGGKADTSNQPNSDSSTSASDSLSPDQCGLPTATNMEDLGPKQSWPDHTSSSSPQDEKKQRSISVSSNLNHFLISLFHLPFSGQQGLPEKQKKWHLSACDVPSTPGLSTSRKQSELSSCSDIPECSANIFKTTCDLEKENAHFIVVDMVLEVLEGVKWTLGLNQWTSMTDTHQPVDDNVRSHRHASSAQESRTPERKHRYDARSLKQSYSDAKPESHEHRLSDEMSPTHLSYVHTSQHTQVKQDDWGNNEAGRQPKASILSTDSGFEDCGVDSTPTTKDSLRNAECLAQQLVLQFKRSWLPSLEPRRGRLSLRSSLQELPGTGNVAASGGSLTEEIRLRTRMRGSLSWAPPRFQIIFTVQPTLRRSEVVALQHFLCAGCGTEVEPRYIKKLRYCDYLGRYFCDCCHSGSEAVIPGRVLSCWDFGRYPVSDFSKQLLDSVWCQPLFDLSSVGKTLCSRVKELDKFRELQEHLLGIKKLLRTCRLSERVKCELEQLPAHLFSVQPPLFSMDDLLRVKKGHLVTQAKAVLQSAITHVESCELCLARGFVCEFCRERDIIFPFQRDICSRCPVCKTCFHKHCFVDKKCPKCVRIQTRKKQPDRSMKRQDS